MIVKEMSQADCEAVVSETRLARLACSMDGQSYVVPINFAFAKPYFYSFSMPGQKIEWMRANPKVCLLFEKFTGGREWLSVVCYGSYEELPDRIGWKHEREHAWSLLGKHANWWEPGSLKPVPGPVASASTHLFYRIKAEQMTGRQAVDDAG